jgi:threonyl-tRNA synthetase
MIIVGEEESENEEVSVRIQGDGDVGKFKLDEFIGYFNSLLAKE